MTTPLTSGAAASGGLRDRWLLSLCLARALMYVVFMVYAACLPVLLDAWQMSAAQAGTVSGAFMLSYAVSLVVASWLAGRAGARRVFLWSAWTSGATALAFGTLAHDYASALVLYALAALTLGGTYAPAVMLLADRYARRVRGRAVGLLVASTSVGYAGSLLLSSVLLGVGGYRLAMLVCGALPLAGAVLATLVLRETENRVHAPAGNESSLHALLANRDAVRLVVGYTGHSWELLGMWQWLPAFLAASLALAGDRAVQAAALGAGFTGAMHACGALAASSMGGLSDRLGRRGVLIALALAGGVLSCSLGWLVAAPFTVLVAIALVYGFVLVGDSPVLSTALTESVAPAHLGTALAVRSVLGFGGGAVAPVVFGLVLDAVSGHGPPGLAWGLAFASLGAGGLLAAWSALGLRSRP